MLRLTGLCTVVQSLSCVFYTLRHALTVTSFFSSLFFKALFDLDRVKQQLVTLAGR